jgi:DNA-binding MarR family transcriptional regulator
VQAAGRRPPRTPTENLLVALRAIREAVAQRERRAVVVVDELPAGELGQMLFGQLRDELWSIPATWVVAIEAGERGAFVRPPASAFFETVVTVGPLPEAASVELLRRRTGKTVPRSLLHEVAGAAGGNARRLISLARDALLEGRSVDELAGARAASRRRALQLGEAAARLFGYLETKGAASASDEQMLRELGWSRSRATQVLRELEQAGLVEAMSERGESGRRKVYAPTEPGGEH